ncbi:MAG: MvdD family ATP-grasp ribosomal peptide maturase [Candidatus Aminicenantes bacterium]|nr:MAG: MvdD family ATP-grasp ribosomal peptide maturase [Candidatus Aminicenantes bacterium]
MKKILIITYSEDNECIDMVNTAVKEKNGETYRFNTDLFPTEIQLSLAENNKKKCVVISGPEGELNLEEITGIWYRRVQLGDKIPKTMDPELRKASILETRTVFFGFLESADTFVLDPVSKIRIASHKQLQLQIAKRVGLEIPRTLTTNKPEEVREFFSTCKNGMITKMLTSFSVHEGEKEKVVFTNLVKAGDLEDLDGLSYCPMTFQENVPKELELRITIVGNQVFAASLDSKASQLAQNDWRRDGLGLIDCWKAYSLPPGIKTKLLQLMDCMGLNYGAVDMIVTPDNRHVFLEINPAGEFFWLELHEPKFPISRAIADVLLGEGFRR